MRSGATRSLNLTKLGPLEGTGNYHISHLPCFRTLQSFAPFRSNSFLALQRILHHRLDRYAASTSQRGSPVTDLVGWVDGTFVQGEQELTCQQWPPYEKFPSLGVFALCPFGSLGGPFCGFGSPLGLLFCPKVPFFSILALRTRKILSFVIHLTYLAKSCYLG